MIQDAEAILKICGLGTYLQLGCGSSKLVYELLKRSIDAYGTDTSSQVVANNLECAPGRFFEGSLLNYPLQSKSFDTIIIGDELLTFKKEHLSAAFRALASIAKRNLVIHFSRDNINQLLRVPVISHRAFWEKLAIDAGFRLHPRSMLYASYYELENEQVNKMLFFERIPDAALKSFPSEWLLENRDLHSDMLRETGRRAEGYVSRYVMAAMKIRPGDTVLDAACGLGYGTAVLAACSNGANFIGVDMDETAIAYAEANFSAQNPNITYRACDVAKMKFLADHSVDVVISFDTIEYVKDYDIFLAEIKRVLKPDGRVIGSVPNLWPDEMGKGSNARRLHVFDWQKLKAAFDKYFIVEERWLHIAGGGSKLRDNPRSLHKVPLNNSYSMETEWWIISACADPTLSPSIPYKNPFLRNKSNEVPLHVNFENGYDNPWVYRVLVQLGERLSDYDALIKFAVKVANESRNGSADQGAALCVLSYQLLEAGQVSTTNLSKLVSSINIFNDNYDRKNLHAHRWAVSLHYVGGRLLLLYGNREEALSAFLTCAEMDPLTFSPLLATKTISGRMYAGLILAGDNKIEEARAQFAQGVQAAHRVLQGDWKNIIGSTQHPLPFGLQEVAEVADVASQCAQALHALDKNQYAPGFFWERINLKRFGVVEWAKSMEHENTRLRGG